MSFVPDAWIGYAVDREKGGFYVKICERCHDAKQALAEASKSGLRTHLTLCSAHVYHQNTQRLGEQDVPNL